MENGTLTVVGTYGYMSPEQFGGRAVTTSDLYSLGATLIYLASGMHPADLPQKDLQIQFEDKTQLSRHFTGWLKKVLEPSQEKRFSSAQVALEALQKPEKVNLSFANYTAIKPVDTKIILNKNQEKIEIIKPGTGWVFNSLAKLVNNLLSTFVGLCFFMVFRNFPLIGWLLSLIILWLGLVKWADFIFELFGQTRLVIDKNKIYLSYENFRVEIQKTPPISPQRYN